MQSQTKAYLFALLTIVFWSTMSSAFKLTLSIINYQELVFYAVWAAVAALMIVAVLQRKQMQILKQTKSELASSMLMGLINPAAYYLVLFRAYELLPAQEAGVLNYSWPVVLVLLSAIFLGQKIGWMGFVSIFISFSGLLIISTKGRPFALEFSSASGVALAIGSAFLWASYWIMNLRDKRNAVVKLTTNMLFGAIYISLFMLISGNLRLVPPTGLAGAMYIGTFEMGITFVLWLLALENSTNTAKVSNLIFLSPFIALFWIRLLVGEKILLSTVAGLALIIAGIVLQQMTLVRKQPQPLQHES
ncbi:MAG TPA: DMT family transporter [Bacteroidales bacterium]|nr:DMT family transporter [Bacteroidales bacterium]